MSTKMEAYLPRWVLKFVLPLLGLVWITLTFTRFFTESGREEIRLVEWLGATAILVFVGVMLWLMGSGRLPAYVIEPGDSDNSKDT